MVSNAWKQLSPDKVAEYYEIACQDRNRYEEEKAAYKGPWKVQSDDSAPPKKPLSPFLRFSQSMRRRVSRDHPDKKGDQITRIIAQLWKTSEPSVREEWRSQYNLEWAQYKLDLQCWKNAKAEIEASVAEFNNEQPDFVKVTPNASQVSLSKMASHSASHKDSIVSLLSFSTMLAPLSRANNGTTEERVHSDFMDVDMTTSEINYLTSPQGLGELREVNTARDYLSQRFAAMPRASLESMCRVVSLSSSIQSLRVGHHHDEDDLVSEITEPSHANDMRFTPLLQMSDAPYSLSNGMSRTYSHNNYNNSSNRTDHINQAYGLFASESCGLTEVDAPEYFSTFDSDATVVKDGYEDAFDNLDDRDMVLATMLLPDMADCSPIGDSFTWT
jgi:HMG (high mobility group) box